MTQIKIVRGHMTNIERLVNLELKKLQEQHCIVTNMELYYIDDRDSEHIVWITYKKPIEEGE